MTTLRQPEDPEVFTPWINGCVHLKFTSAGMKILLRQKKTGLYFQHPGIWLREIEAASDFGNSQKAIDHINAQCLSGVQVVAVFVGGGYVESVAFQIESLPRLPARARA
jgi:hypothetical protein